MLNAGCLPNPQATVSFTRRTRSWLRQCLHWMLILTLVAVQSVLPIVHAQSTGESTSPGIDVDPPTIELEETPSGIAGESQVFTALVADNQALKDVKLYYRYSGQGPFTSLAMLPLSDTGYYTAKIPTSRSETRSIEYYLQARDQSGNRVVTGYAFDPLIRTLSIEQPPKPTIGAAPVDTSTDNNQGSASSGIKWWHVALGVLAAGAIAAGLSGGDEPGNGVPITLTATPPN